MTGSSQKIKKGIQNKFLEKENQGKIGTENLKKSKKISGTENPKKSQSKNGKRKISKQNSKKSQAKKVSNI